ncbi:MAG: hypothetical protein AAF366_18760 [Pseudomonadota bacterium]
MLKNTMGTLARWAETDPDLGRWLAPHQARLSADPRKSVARAAV